MASQIRPKVIFFRSVLMVEGNISTQKAKLTSLVDSSLQTVHQTLLQYYPKGSDMRSPITHFFNSSRMVHKSMKDIKVKRVQGSDSVP